MANQEVTTRSLTRKQEAFIAHYIVTLNATESARRAGYDAQDNSLFQIGHENLRKPMIASRIDALLAEHAPSAPRLVRECADVALQSADDLIDFDEQGRPYVNLQKLADRNLLHTVESVEYSEKGRLKVKRQSKMDAIDKLLRLKGMFPTAYNGAQQGNTYNTTVNIDTMSKEDKARAILAALRGGSPGAVPAIDGEWTEEEAPTVDLGPQGDDY